MQSKRNSFIEANINTLSGFFVSWFVMHFIVPALFGFEIGVSQSLSITLLFTVVSVIRNYLIRRAFNYYYLKKL